MPGPVAVLLIDGVGNCVKFPRRRDCLVIEVGDWTFTKTDEFIDAMEVYRQSNVPPAERLRHMTGVLELPTKKKGLTYPADEA